MSKVGIIGATGYVGIELLRLLLNHPFVTVEAISSSSFKGEEIASVYKMLLHGDQFLIAPRTFVKNGETIFYT